MSEDVKECNTCVYCKEKDYCIRKRDKIINNKICMHYVNSIGSFSMGKLIDKLVKVLS